MRMEAELRYPVAVVGRAVKRHGWEERAGVAWDSRITDVVHEFGWSAAGQEPWWLAGSEGRSHVRHALRSETTVRCVHVVADPSVAAGVVAVRDVDAKGAALVLSRPAPTPLLERDGKSRRGRRMRGLLMSAMKNPLNMLLSVGGCKGLSTE